MALDPSTLFLSSWGDIQLFISKLEWEGGETQVVHDLGSGDDHPVQPRGSHLRKAIATLLFDDFEGAQETGISAFRRFQASTGQRRIFVHPFDGAYYARIGDFKPASDDSSILSATCEFIPDRTVTPVSPAGAGTGGLAGETSVVAAAEETNQALADAGVGFQPRSIAKLDFSKSITASIGIAFSPSVRVGVAFSANIGATLSVSATAAASTSAAVLASSQVSRLSFVNAYSAALAEANATPVAETSGMPSPNAFAFAYACAALDADARASVASWNDDDDVAIRKILIDVARLSDSIGNMIVSGGFEDDLDLWPAFVAALLLGDSIRSAAIAATSETPTVFVMRVQSPVALLPIAAKIYGGADAQERARQIASLNDIKTTGWLDPGDYLMPTRPRSDRSALLGEIS